MRFTAARLTVGETSCHSTFENGLHQRLGRVFVHFLIVTRIVKRVIKSEMLVLQILGQVNLEKNQSNQHIFHSFVSLLVRQ